MKTPFKYCFSFFMILILLVSTLQISLYKMECLMSGNTQISLSSFEDCKKTTQNENSVSTKCCDFHDITLDFDYDTNSVKEIKTFITSAYTLELKTVLLKTVFRTSDFNFYTNLPPPSGYELLKIVQVFRL